jgi:PAS domain S-box-containing protein
MYSAPADNTRTIGALWRYLLAPAATAAALLLRWTLQRQLGDEVPYITFFPAVMIAAGWGGLGPGLLSVVLSSLAACFLEIPPYFRIPFRSPGQVLGLAMFIVTGAFICGFQELLDRARRAERTIRLRHYQTLASIGDGVIATDRAGRIEFMNTVAERLTGWSNAEARGAPIGRVFRSVTEPDGIETPSPIHRAIDEEKTVTLAGNVRLISKDGRRIPLEESAAPVRDAQGAITGAVLAFRDITERRAAEQALLESRNRIAEILESIADAFIALDGDFRFTYVNREAARFLRNRREVLLGKCLWEECPELCGGTFETECRRAAVSGTPVHFELYAATSCAWYEFHVYPSQTAGLALYFRDVSERKDFEKTILATKQEAERTRDLFQITLASIGDAVIATDAQGRITFLNGVAETLTSWTAADAAGQHLATVFRIQDERSGAVVEDPAVAALRENRTVELANHVVLRSRDGRLTPIDDSAAPIRDSAGNLLGVVLVFRDVTERRRARAEVERSESRLRLALDAGRIGVWDWDIAHDAIDWSDRAYEIHGVAPGDFGGRLHDFTRLIHPEDLETVSERIQESLEGRREYNLEFRIVRPDGRVRWVQISARVFRDETGRPVRMLGATLDITERHETEQALRDGESRLQLALEAGRMAAWAWDWKTNEVSWSVSHYRLMGVDPGKRPVTYVDWSRFVHPDDLPRVEEAIQQAIRERSEYRSEYRVIWPDGSVHWMEARGRLTYGRDATPLRMLGVLIDITERKRTEEFLLRANEELQHFAYAASHDLQEPLRTINAFSQLLVRQYRGNLPPDAEQYVRYIVEGTRRMSDLIHGLLALSRAGGMETEPLQAVSSRQVLDSTLETLTAAIAEAGAEVRIGHLPVVLGDPSQLSQLFQNLISNAIKYHKPAVPPTIDISAERTSAGWRFAVRDNGIGFSPDAARQIFAPFKRLHGSEVPGAGIGLALCRRIVERHQGTIWADSQPGVGSTFYFTLPGAEPRLHRESAGAPRS